MMMFLAMRGRDVDDGSIGPADEDRAKIGGTGLHIV
jgi:hypothetical protein